MGDAVKNKRKLEEQYIEKAYIEWMIDGLDQQKLGILYVAAGMERNLHKACRLPKKFLLNNLLLKNTRRRLAEKQIVPIVDYLIEEADERKEWTEEEIVEKGEEKEANIKEIALSLFLQNYYSASYNLYRSREKSGTAEKDMPNEEKAGKEQDISKKQHKIIKKLEAKVDTLTQEKEALQHQARELKAEVKQLQQMKAKETADLRQLLGKSEAEAERVKEQVEQLQKAAQEKEQAAELIIAEPVKKEKIALLGNPKNTAILRNDKLQIDVFEAEEIGQLVEQRENYKMIFILSYAIDQVIIERSISEKIRKQMIPVENFLELRRRLGGLLNV